MLYRNTCLSQLLQTCAFDHTYQPNPLSDLCPSLASTFLSSVTDVISSLHILLKLFLHTISYWIAVVQIYGRQRVNLRTHADVCTYLAWIHMTRTHTKQNPCSSTARWVYKLPIPTTSILCFVFCFICV